MNHLERLASTQLMLAGCATLAGALLCAPEFGDRAWLAICVPLVVLCINLAAAIATRRRLRQGGLGVFHVALLALMVAGALGRLMHLDARIEIAEGATFDVRALDIRSRGPLHPGRLDEIRLIQGPFTTEYAAGVKRGHTRSEVAVHSDDGGVEFRTVGDDAPVRVAGYRLYTTHNKGFAPIIQWERDGTVPVVGALHMPSYPMFDGRQQLYWTPPGSTEVRFWLQLDTPIDESVAWRLDPARARASLVIDADGRRSTLRVGERVRVQAGTIRYEGLSGWMGYRVYYDPSLPWLFAFSVSAVMGLAAHLVRRSPLRDGLRGGRIEEAGA